MNISCYSLFETYRLLLDGIGIQVKYFIRLDKIFGKKIEKHKFSYLLKMANMFNLKIGNFMARFSVSGHLCFLIKLRLNIELPFSVNVLQWFNHQLLHG